LKSRLSEVLATDKNEFIKRYGREATLGDKSLLQESATIWDNRLAGRTFQLHRQKVLYDLMHFLLANDLAWKPRYADGIDYVEMHPRLGEAILATLAFGCAKSQGLSLVTEFPQIYGRTIHRTKEEIFKSCLDLSASKKAGQPSDSKAEGMVEFVVHQRCNVDKLTPEALLELNKDWEAVGAFRDQLEKLVADVPASIDDPKALHERFGAKADRMFAQWREDNKNLSKRIRDLLSGDGDEAAKVLEKLIEKSIGAEAGSAAVGSGLTATILGGNITYHALLGAGAGLALAVVVRTGKNIIAARKKRKEDPLRYLTLMEKAGVSYVASN
jgi:hypothetical protein